MKNRFVAMFLALVLCMGLAVPAFAAEVDDILADINGSEIWIDVKDVDSLRKEIPVKLRLWSPDEAGVTWTKTTGTLDDTVKVIELPLGVTLTAGPDNKWVSGMFVYSDPDGDGIFEQRMEADPKKQGKAVVPVTEAGPLRGTSETVYSSIFDWGYGLNYLSYSKYSGYRTLTTDYLVEIFGSNTLVEFWDTEGKNKRYILLTGEARPENLAYDKLEDHGIQFTDVGDLVSAWAVEPVTQAADAGLVQYEIEEDHNFDLREKITRGQFAATVMNLYMVMANKNPYVPEEIPFKDVAEDYAYRDFIAVAHELGIVNGTTEATFDPDALVTREQAAAMLSRVYTALGGEIPEVDATAFSDDASISGYAKGAVAFMNEHGIIGGVGGNTFAPKGDTTVEQALKIAVEMLNNLKVK